MNIEIKNELRPCLVTTYKDGHSVKGKVVAGMFHGIWQHAHVFDPILRGQVGGQNADPVAVVEINGRLQKVNVYDVEFTDVAKEQANESK